MFLLRIKKLHMVLAMRLYLPAHNLSELSPGADVSLKSELMAPSCSANVAIA